MLIIDSFGVKDKFRFFPSVLNSVTFIFIILNYQKLNSNTFEQEIVDFLRIATSIVKYVNYN